MRGKRGKNEAAHPVAIFEAATRPTMRFVPVQRKRLTALLKLRVFKQARAMQKTPAVSLATPRAQWKWRRCGAAMVVVRRRILPSSNAHAAVTPHAPRQGASHRQESRYVFRGAKAALRTGLVQQTDQVGAVRDLRLLFRPHSWPAQPRPRVGQDSARSLRQQTRPTADSVLRYQRFGATSPAFRRHALEAQG